MKSTPLRCSWTGALRAEVISSALSPQFESKSPSAGLEHIIQELPKIVEHTTFSKIAILPKSISGKEKCRRDQNAGDYYCKFGRIKHSEFLPPCVSDQP